jgi:hypothetical protein
MSCLKNRQRVGRFLIIRYQRSTSKLNLRNLDTPPGRLEKKIVNIFVLVCGRASYSTVTQSLRRITMSAKPSTFGKLLGSVGTTADAITTAADTVRIGMQGIKNQTQFLCANNDLNNLKEIQALDVKEQELFHQLFNSYN